jgi:DNA-binding transcriptional regulator YiaG
MSRIHPLARTTPRTRAKIREATGSAAKIAKRYNISMATVRQWRRP